MSTVSRRAPVITQLSVRALAADPAFIPPQAGGAGDTIGTLRSYELETAIRERRQAAGVAPLPADEKQCTDLVGLALSGGGIRSAVYNLGFLQALSHRGLLRHVDYCCSVSGGGYIGGHLAALADHLGDQQVASVVSSSTTERDPLMEESSPANRASSDENGAPRFKSFHDARASTELPSRLADLGVDASGKLLPEYRFRHVGEYLFYDPVQFIWRYLFYTGPMLVLAISSLGILATLIALLWRVFDMQWTRDVLHWTGIMELGTATGLGNEFPMAFLPCLLPLAGLMVGAAMFVTSQFWNWKRGVWWGNAIAKWSVVAGVLCLGASLAVFLGNGETQFGNGIELVKVQSYLTWPLLFITLLFLVPFVRFRSVVNSAREGAPEWQAIAARFVIGGACTLTPFFLIHLMARENISGIAQHRDPELLLEDVTQWSDYLRWRDEMAAASQLPKPGNQLAIVDGIEGLANYEAQHLGPPHQDRHERVFDINQWFTQRNWLRPNTWQAWPRPLWLVEYPLRGDKSVIGGGLKALNDLRAKKRIELATFNEKILGSDALTRQLHAELLDLVAAQPLAAPFKAKTAEPGSRNVSQESIQKFLATRTAKLTAPEREKFDQLWRRARGDEVDQAPQLANLSTQGWSTIEVKDFNRLLLEVLHPEFIRQRAMVSTLIVPPYDQNERFRWLFCWSAFFTIACLIDFNRSSPFFVYYRDRLHQRFLHMPAVKRGAAASTVAANTGNALQGSAEAQANETEDHRDSNLRDLKPWKTGAPYPLFLGSLHLFDRVSPRGNSLGRNAVDADRCLPFLFSPLYCGSVYTGFRQTSDYCQGNLSVGDAVAISGAAVTPFMTNNSGLLAMMAAFNLRIGKWLPRPDQPALCAQEPTVRPLRVAWEWIKAWRNSYRDTWRFGLAADGGFHEFFGLEELLLRRCRLIIVSDAGCNNGKFEFGAFADTIRLVRERHGIEFLDLDHDQPVDLQRLRRHPESSQQDQHHMCLRVRYPDDFPVPGPREALIVYGQMSLTGDEPLDLQQFRKVNPNFPDEPTTNQSYDETQVESFRQLGYHVGEKICERAPLRTAEADESASVPISIELWIDWLRWGYTADCSQVAPLRGNRLRKVDPCSEGLEFSPQRDLRWKEEQRAAAEGFRQYLASAKVREESLLHVSQLLSDTPNRCGIRLGADELVKLVLACHDSRADFHCAGRRDLFEVGGRKNLIRAAATATVKLKDLSGNLNGTHDCKIAVAAAFYRQLCRGVFSGGNSRTSAMATLCLLDQIILIDRQPDWRNALDCVVALVRLTRAGKLWKTKKLIASWYEPLPTPTNGNGQVVQINAQNVRVAVKRE